jgi:hypothetical protein
MVGKAEDTVLARQAEPTTAIKNEMIMPEVKGNTLLQRHITVYYSQAALGYSQLRVRAYGSELQSRKQ